MDNLWKLGVDTIQVIPYVKEDDADSLVLNNKKWFNARADDSKIFSSAASAFFLFFFKSTRL